MKKKLELKLRKNPKTNTDLKTIKLKQKIIKIKKILKLLKTNN